MNKNTFKNLESHCYARGIVCERYGRKIEMTTPDGSTTAECSTVQEGFDTLQNDSTFSSLPIKQARALPDSNLKKAFKMNQICFDSQNKEIVKLTNGIELNKEFIPTEALAIRVVSLNAGKPVLGFTYRKINSEFLSDAKDGGQFETILNQNKPLHYEFIGRI